MPTKAELEQALAEERAAGAATFASIARHVVDTEFFEVAVQRVVRAMMHTAEAKQWVEDIAEDALPGVNAYDIDNLDTFVEDAVESALSNATVDVSIN